LPLAILIISQCDQQNIGAYYEAKNQRSIEPSYKEEKIYSNATIEDNYDDSSVLVVLDKKTGGINKTHKKSFFGSFETEYIKDLTEIKGDIDSKEYLNKEQFRQILMIKLPTNSKSNVLDVVKKLEKVEGILYAGPDYYLYPAANNSNDPLLPNQWGLNGTYGINAPAAWDITTGARGINVGIIDTGIASHPDLNGNVIQGFNFVDYDDITDDTDGHGTKVAGIAGAVGNNGSGITGVCWDLSMVPLRMSTGSGTQIGALQSPTIQAISLAISANIGILNYSQNPAFDFPNLTTTTFQPLYDAIDNYTGLFVQAAGNENGNINPSGSNPAPTRNYFVGLRKRNGVERNNVIIVGAINISGNRWVDTVNGQGSNYGNSTVHLFAPGGGIVSTISGGGFLGDSGTSFAAPHVAGVAALLKSVNPFLTTLQVKNAILTNVTKYSGASDSSSGGRLNAQAAVNSLGTVVGFIDLNYNNSGVYEKIGRFYLFNNGKWTFVERGFRRSPQASPNLVRYPLASYLQMGPVPSAVSTFLGNRVINTPIEVLIPAMDPRMGQHHGGVTVNIQITKNGVTITDGNSIRAVDSDAFCCYVFKIANKQGTL